MKLYEIILKKLNNFFNPSMQTKTPASEETDKGVKIGDFFKIDTIDTVDLRFEIKEIRENQVGKLKFTDYVLSQNNSDDFRLRLFKDSRDNDVAIILKIHDSLEYDEGFHDLVKNSEEFEMHDDLNDNDESNDIHEKFWRINDVKVSYKSKIAVKTKEGSSVDSVEYWDYSRITQIDSVEVEEFVFVEMNKETGMFTIWRGTSVPAERITAF
ncbi:MAG: hypothetical protein EKK64_00355 [Neisseriaceae bacterium]|nr:MAG: hypothetical protein EKK64_00355 [Neisseriaceae bacterium]